MILTLVAMLSMTTAFAEGEMVMGANNMEAYELNVNINKLSEALDLADDQKEAVADIHHTFASELMFAAQYGENDRKKLVARALVPYLPLTAELYDEQSWTEQVRITH